MLFNNFAEYMDFGVVINVDWVSIISKYVSNEFVGSSTIG